MQNLSNHAASNCNTQKCQGLSNLHTKNWKLDGVLLQNPALCPGVPNQWGAQFAGAQSAVAQSVGAQFVAPGGPIAAPGGPICRSTKKCAAQFA